MKRIAVAAVVAILSASASASEPTPAQINQIEAVLGLDAAIPAVVDKAIPAEAATVWTPAQRACVVGGFSREFELRLQASLGRGFASGENIEAWIAFSRTAGGKKMMDIFGRAVTAAISGTASPDAQSEAAALSPVEQKDILAFMATPAAKLLDGDLIPGFVASDAESQALAHRVIAACDLPDASGSR